MLEQLIRRKTRTTISFFNGRKIKALPCGRQGQGLRGETTHLAIIDEAAFVPENIITEVISPMLATTNGTLLMISTPFDRDHYFYRAFNSHRWSRYRFETKDNPSVTEEFLAEQREAMGERRFRQEYLAEFLDDTGTYFPMSLLRNVVHVCEGRKLCEYCLVIAGKKDPSGDLYAGYDPGGMTDPAAFVVVKKIPSQESSKPAFEVVLTKTFLAPKGTKDVTNVYTQFTVEIADYHKRLHFHNLMTDATGIGSPIVEHGRELKLPIHGLNLGRGIQEEMFSNAKIIMEREKIVLPDKLDLLSSLNSIIAKRTRLGGYTFDHAKGSHDDLAYALALALWGARSSPVVIMNVS